MKLTGTVQNGNIVVDLPEGTPVTIVVEERDLPPGQSDEVDENGDYVLTPEFEAEFERAESSTTLVPLDAVLDELRQRRR